MDYDLFIKKWFMNWSVPLLLLLLLVLSFSPIIDLLF